MNKIVNRLNSIPGVKRRDEALKNSVFVINAVNHREILNAISTWVICITHDGKSAKSRACGMEWKTGAIFAMILSSSAFASLLPSLAAFESTSVARLKLKAVPMPREKQSPYSYMAESSLFSTAFSYQR